MSMSNNEPVYITGHQHPDTDSVVSAIAYALFKRAMGIKAVPCCLGKLSNETKYLLDRFGYEEPMLLSDARKTLKEISYDEPLCVTADKTIMETINTMKETNRPGFAVVDEEKHLIGFISKSDLMDIGLGDTAHGIDLLRQTSAKNIAKTISGQLIYDDPQMHINGKVSIIALTQSGLENYEIHDRIVIMGDDPEAQIKLIEKGAGILIVVWTQAIREDVLEAAREHHCPVIISGHGSMNTSRYIYFAPEIRLVMTQKPVFFRDTDLAEEAGRKMLTTRFRNYPILDSDDHLIGYVSRYHIMNYQNKKIILVDHNEFSQSVKAVEKAQILEVVDHHRINDFATSQPVSFRNEIVGSTATIIATMYRENQIPIPQKLAGLLLGAVLSDTLLLQSPTTTRKDRETANILAALADLDVETFGREMFEATASNMNQSIQEMIVQDIKYFEISGCRTMISQAMVTSTHQLWGKERDIQRELNKLVEKKELDLLVAAFTSVSEDGSVFFAAGEQADKCFEAFPGIEDHLHVLQKGILSRKSQILPEITRVLNNS